MKIPTMFLRRRFLSSSLFPSLPSLCRFSSSVSVDCRAIPLSDRVAKHARLSPFAENEVKLLTIASTRILCEYLSLLDPSAKKLWGEMLDGIVHLISHNEQELSKNTASMPGEDPVWYFCSSLEKLCSSYPDIYPNNIEKSLSPANMSYLVKLCSHYKCEIFRNG